MGTCFKHEVHMEGRIGDTAHSASSVWELPNCYQGHRIPGLSHPQRLESRHLCVHMFSETGSYFSFVRNINQDAFVSQHDRSSQPKALRIWIPGSSPNPPSSIHLALRSVHQFHHTASCRLGEGQECALELSFLG